MAIVSFDATRQRQHFARFSARKRVRHSLISRYVWVVLVLALALVMNLLHRGGDGLSSILWMLAIAESIKRHNTQDRNSVDCKNSYSAIIKARNESAGKASFPAVFRLGELNQLLTRCIFCGALSTSITCNNYRSCRRDVDTFEQCKITEC